MRPFTFVLAMLLAAGTAFPAAAQDSPITTIFTRAPQTSPVAIDYLDVTHPRDSVSPDDQPACITFHNTDARTATSVRFAFVYYDGGGKRGRSDVLTLKGTFTRRQTIEGGKIEARDLRRESCQTLHRPTDFNIVAYYVDHVDFSDGSAWDATGLSFADRAVPGTLRSAPPPLSNAAMPPFFVQSYPTCAAALASSATPGDVVVNVTAGEPLGNGLARIGTVTACRPDASDTPTAGETAVIAALPRAIVRAAAFRVTFPALTVSATCTTGVHLNRRVLFTPLSSVGKRVIKAGVYTGIARVNVRADGIADAAVVTVPAGGYDYDAQIVESALASRYWPAISNGRPVAGTFDFAMRWTVGEEKDDRVGVRVTGPAVKALPADCAPA